MPRSARDYVNSLRDQNQANSNARPDAAEATEANAQTGLYDFPPEDPRSREHVTGRRPSRSTSQISQYRATRVRDEQKRRRSNDTRSKNASLRRTRVEEPTSQANPTDNESRESDQSDKEEVCGIARRSWSRNTHALPRSSSPEPANEANGRPTQTPDQSQDAYKYGNLDHESFIGCAQEEFGLDEGGFDYDTQAIIDRIRLATTEQTPEDASARRSASIVLLPSTPFRVGGGWSQASVGNSQPTGPHSKRSSHAAELSDGFSGRERKHIVVDDDTATEPETEDELANEASARATQILAVRSTAATKANPSPAVRGTQAPPPSLQPSLSAVDNIQPSNVSSPSLGDSSMVAQPPSDEGELRGLPDVYAPLTGPVHARLRLKLISRALARQANKTNDLQANGTDEVPETNFSSTANTPHPITQQSSSNSQTYRGRRSHIRSEPEASRRAGPMEIGDAADESTQPSSPGLTPSERIRRERARAFVAKAREQMAEMAPRRRPLFATASQRPASRPQTRPPLRGDRASVQRMGGVSRRLDPITSARKGMLAFNQVSAQSRATLPESHREDELLTEEEMWAQAKAYGKQRWPQRSRRIRKPKPLARDVSGLERQVLIMAKIHLFAYALVEGVYQTRATYLQWGALIHQATWKMELPDHPYKAPPADILEILVNAIATLRGKIKERLREFVARVSGFRHTTSNKKIIEKNLICFNRLYPNSFHCKTMDPRSGDYENPEIAHCVALALFHGPNSVGVLYPDYFREMPLTVIAFALAIWQFCIEEWANGWRQNGDLGMAAMSDKYEAHLAGLKQLREVAPKRMHRLQGQWKEYIVEYSGALFEPEDEGAPSASHCQIRPDTPEPEAISIEEMNSRLLETARQESVRTRMQELAAEELAQPMDTGENGSDGSITSRSPSPHHDEYNEHGVLTARAKGKSRVN